MSSIAAVIVVIMAHAAAALHMAKPRFHALARELIAATVTPPILGGVVAVSIAGVKEPEGTVLRLVPKRVQTAMRESRIAWVQYTNFEFFFAALAVVAMAPKRVLEFLRVQRQGADHHADCKSYGVGRAAETGDIRAQGACCDVYLPRGAAVDRRFERVMVFVPGGAWSHGAKSFYALTSRRLATELDCAVAVVGYDLYPLADGATQAAQVDAAIRWAQAGAWVGGGTAAEPRPQQSSQQRLLAEGGQVVVIGHSAGGQLCASALLGRGDDDVAKAAGGEKAAGDDGESSSSATAPAEIAALALLSAPFELRRHVAHEAARGVATISALSAAFAADDGATYLPGDEAFIPAVTGGAGADLVTPPKAKTPPRLMDDTQPLASSSPEHVVRTHGATAAAKLPRVVALLHGVDDPVVPMSSTRHFEAALREATGGETGGSPPRAGSGMPRVVASYPEATSHLDYILQLITEEKPPLLDFLRDACGWSGRGEAQQ